MKSVSQRDFSAKVEKPCVIKKPCGTDILFGDVLFGAKTHSHVEFTDEEEDRFKTVTSGSSDIWKASSHNFKRILCLAA